MLTVMIVGLAMGTTVSIARAIGADDRPQAAAATGNTVTLFLSLSLVLTVGLLLLRRPITAVMSTPEAAVEGTVRYLTICFPGIPCITAYNILSAIFRGMGDSKSPMIFIFIACLANIALDYLFIGALHLGPAGAALGTSLSQAISVAISLAVIVRRRTMPLAKADLRPQKPVMDAILKIGVPISVQDGFIQISFIVITVIANRRGLTDAAAVGIVEKIIGFLFLVPSSMLSAVSALGAQNLGAGKPERARSLRCSFLPRRWWACSRRTRRRCWPGGSICAGTSGTASLPGCSSASAVISAPAGGPGCRFCIISCRSSAFASPART